MNPIVQRAMDIATDWYTPVRGPRSLKQKQAHLSTLPTELWTICPAVSRYRYIRLMRWDNLFDDLESQLERESSADELEERAEVERLRIGRLSMRDRIVALAQDAAAPVSRTLRVHLTTGELMYLRPSSFGRDWFAAEIEGAKTQQTCVVPFIGIAHLALDRADLQESLGVAPGQTSQGSLAARLSLPFVLRDLCRRRLSVELSCLSGSHFGTIDRVGRDHLDLAVHERGEVRRESLVSGYRVIALSQLALVRF